ncbi:MAG: hypothetical protein QOF43_105, partial [Gaiellaceae bacterium]|nr:hypothetical protein [Gaiellaceae bacterium]
MAFGHHALQLTAFSSSAAAADGVLSGLSVDKTSGTALYDVVVEAATALRASSQPGRVIVLLTDGHDVSSTSSLAQAVTAAHRAGASVYPIGIESSDFDPAALRTLASETGGTYHGTGSTLELQQVYAAIASELRRTWRVDYDTAARPGDVVRLHARVPGLGAADREVRVPESLGGTQDTQRGLLPAKAYSPVGTIAISLLVAAFVVGALATLVRLRRGSWVKQRLAPHVGETRK